MEAVATPVNWSQVASQAFEDRLASLERASNGQYSSTASKDRSRVCRVTLTIGEPDCPDRVQASYDTADHTVQITGTIYPRDVELVNAVILLIKAEQRHGSAALRCGQQE